MTNRKMLLFIHLPFLSVIIDIVSQILKYFFEGKGVYFLFSSGRSKCNVGYKLLLYFKVFKVIVVKYTTSFKQC